MAKSEAWQRKEGKNPSGGLNAKGRLPTTELIQVSLVLKLHNLKVVLARNHSVLGCQV